MRLVASILAVFAMLATATPAQAAPPRLPDDFLWGVASSGFQSEGYAPPSNWTRYIAQGKVEHPYQNSVDFYHRYPDDIALARQLGVKVYRIGLEWARVQPQPGVWDENGFAFYDKVIRTIKAAGMRPMVTLDHWVYPAWAPGWNNPEMTERWLTYATAAVDRFSRYEPLWVTINEPAAYVAQETSKGGLPVTAVPTMFARLAQVHNAIYDRIHAVQPRAMVTSNVAYVPVAMPVIDGQFLDKVKLDFVGIDYYYGLSPAHPNAHEALTGQLWNAPLEPEGIYHALKFYARKYPDKPLYIVETGMPTRDGSRADGYRRGDNLRDSVYWVQRAKADGMNVIGYNYWSLTDNYEWGSYAPRFGLYTVDVLGDPTLTRRPTDAVAAYREAIARGGVAPGYQPTRAPVWCSLVDAPFSCTEPVR